MSIFIRNIIAARAAKRQRPNPPRRKPAISASRRLPYVKVLAIIAIATALTYIGQWLLDSALFVIFMSAVGICFQLFGLRAGLLSIALSALASDFLFVAPLLTLTRYTVFFAALYSMAGAVWWLLPLKRMAR